MRDILIVLIVAAGVAAMAWAVIYRIEADDWPWEPRARERRTLRRAFDHRVAEYMRRGMTEDDASALVAKERQKESGDIRKAYEEAAS